MKARETGGSDMTITIVAGEAITAKRLVDFEGKHSAALSAMGVALYDADSGSYVSVGVAPIEVVEAGAAITAGAALETDSSGRVVTKSSGVTVGRAMDAAAGAGSFIRMRQNVQ